MIGSAPITLDANAGQIISNKIAFRPSPNKLVDQTEIKGKHNDTHNALMIYLLYLEIKNQKDRFNQVLFATKKRQRIVASLRNSLNRSSLL